MGRLVRVRAVQPLEGFRVLLEFEDGTERVVDLGIYLHGPVFDAIRRDPAMFRAIRVEHGTVVWPNGADIDPDVLYYGLRPAWMEHEQLLDNETYRQELDAAGLAVREPGETYTPSSEQEDAH